MKRKDAELSGLFIISVVPSVTFLIVLVNGAVMDWTFVALCALFLVGLASGFAAGILFAVTTVGGDDEYDD